jgi:hypothetical protein
MEAVMLADQLPAPDDTPRQPPKECTCLRCRKTFSSAHAGNRICEGCAGAVQSERSAML